MCSIYLVFLVVPSQHRFSLDADSQDSMCRLGFVSLPEDQYLFEYVDLFSSQPSESSLTRSRHHRTNMKEMKKMSIGFLWLCSHPNTHCALGNILALSPQSRLTKDGSVHIAFDTEEVLLRPVRLFQMCMSPRHLNYSKANCLLDPAD